jgi:hypothetical protein
MSSLVIRLNKAEPHANNNFLSSHWLVAGPSMTTPVVKYFLCTFKKACVKVPSLQCSIMFDILCSFPLSSDLFAQAIHPREPLVAVGLASGHVETFRLPPIQTDDSDPSSPTKGFGLIESAWRTRRHKVSCRCVSYSFDGSTLYSAGAEGIVKAANAETGQVSSKVAIPSLK